MQKSPKHSTEENYAFKYAASRPGYCNDYCKQMHAASNLSKMCPISKFRTLLQLSIAP